MFLTNLALHPIALIFLLSSARSYVNAGCDKLWMARRTMTPLERVQPVDDRGQFANMIMTVSEAVDRPLEVLDLVVAIERDDRFRVDELMSAGFYKHCPCPVVATLECLNPLQFAVYHKRTTWIRILLDTGYFDVNCKTEKNGSSLLHLSVVNADLENMRLLVDSGVNIDAVNREGLSVLALSTMFSDLELFTFLVEHKAKVDVQVAIAACSYETSDALVETLKHPGLLINELGAEGRSVLHYGIRNKFSTHIIELILGYAGLKIDVGERESGWTALHLACKMQNFKLAKLLLDRGANPLASDLKMNRPKAFINHDSIQLERLLIEAEKKRMAIDVATLIQTASSHPEGGAFQYMPFDIMKSIGGIILALSAVQQVVPVELERRLKLSDIRAERIARVRNCLDSDQAINLISKPAIERITICLDTIDLALESHPWNKAVAALKRRLEEESEDFEHGFYIPFFVIHSIDALKDRPVALDLELEDFLDYYQFEDLSDGSIPSDLDL